MAETKWTPGKWFVSGVRGKIDREEYHAINVEGGGPQIGIIWYNPKSHEGFADAHLIAAAPELADSSSSLVDRDCAVYGGKIVIEFGNHGEAQKALRDLRAALAKARGEA